MVEVAAMDGIKATFQGRRGCSNTATMTKKSIKFRCTLLFFSKPERNILSLHEKHAAFLHVLLPLTQWLRHISMKLPFVSAL